MSDTYIGNTPAGADKWHADTPIGAIMAWPNSQLPLGWLECNGQATTQYPDLLALIGSTVPDLRGEFIRGFDNGKGTDIGRALGTSQSDDFAEHTHKEKFVPNGTNVDTRYPGLPLHAAGSAVEADVTTAPTGGVETRPTNVALKYIIKAFNVLQTGETTSYLPIGKNYLINPTFSINQREYAGTTLGTGSGDYGYDRWKASGSSTHTLSGITLTVNTSAMRQWVEALPAGIEMTVSWEGTSSMYVNGVTTSSSSPFTFTTTGSNIDLIVTTGTVSKPKLELGATQTPFEYPSDATELVKCQRYYNRYRGAGGAGYASNAAEGARCLTTLVHSSTMRVTPTYAAVSVTVNSVNVSGSPVAFNNSAASSSVSMLSVAAGSLFWYMTGGYLEFDAEI